MGAENRKSRAIAVMASAALAAGCAGGGGGSGWQDSSPPPPPKSDSSQKKSTASRCGSGGFDTLLFGGWCPTPDFGTKEWDCLYLNINCDSVAASVAPAATPSRFIGWQQLAAGAKAATLDSRASLSYGNGADTSAAWSSEAVTVERDSGGTLKGFNPGTPFILQDSLARFGQPGILATASGTTTDPLALVANPYSLGWNYQSFGVWNEANAVKASSFGAPTPAAAIPVTGTATFTGKLAGFYISPTGERSVAAADVRVSTNFSTRSLDFASSGTFLAGDLQKANAAPGLNLSGTLTYQRNYNAFSGTLTSAGGTLSGATAGSFHGPAAEELGGAFALKSKTSAEAFAGAYGAKR